MNEVKILELKQDIFKANEVTADGIREELAADSISMINVMSSPGSGKTTTLVRMIRMLQGAPAETVQEEPCEQLAREVFRAAVMECDIDASVDAETISAAGARSIQLHTGGMCHMDAAMTKQGLDEMGTEDLDVIFLENVGNLVCPAEFDTGAHLNLTILSIPEGDDKPAKYPLMYEVSDVVLINKIDAAPVFDFDMEACKGRILTCNPNAVIFPVSAKTGEGFDAWMKWLRDWLARA